MLPGSGVACGNYSEAGPASIGQSRRRWGEADATCPPSPDLYPMSEWIERVRFRVTGKPIGQPRTRRSSNGGVFTPEKIQPWKTAIFLAAKDLLPDEPFQGPIKLDTVFLFQPPKTITKKHRESWPYHTAKPDKDNLEKSVMDALQQKERYGQVLIRGFWRDDSQVVSGGPEKRYAEGNEEPGVIVTISTLEQFT